LIALPRLQRHHRSSRHPAPPLGFASSPTLTSTLTAAAAIATATATATRFSVRLVRKQCNSNHEEYRKQKFGYDAQTLGHVAYGRGKEPPPSSQGADKDVLTRERTHLQHFRVGKQQKHAAKALYTAPEQCEGLAFMVATDRSCQASSKQLACLLNLSPSADKSDAS
ncbi:hypothetical protein KCU95_g101, partial [Aureobasidium melanogenum]